MNADASPNATDARPQKLAIVHLLGWTLGVAAVLGIYRAAAVWHAEDGQPVQMTWPALGYGLAYGTAISGLGLFLWRWWRSSGQSPGEARFRGPTQPGHWLLVFAGIGLVIDVSVAAAVDLLCAFREPSHSAHPWLVHQVVGWSIGWLIGLAVLLNLRDASRLWMVAVMLVVIWMMGNAVFHALTLVHIQLGWGGFWPWWMTNCFRVFGLAAVSAAVAAAEWWDRLNGASRDWLHFGGIAAALALGAVDVAVNAPALWR